MTNAELIQEVNRYYSDNFDYISSDQPTLSILTNIARHFVSKAYLQRYIDEAVYRFNTKELKESARFGYMFKKALGTCYYKDVKMAA